MSYNTIIFDLDGTLIDTLYDLADSINQALAQLSLPTHSVDSYRLRIGDGARQMISRALPDGRADLIDTAQKMQQAYYLEHCYDHTQPYPGIVDTLELLKGQHLKLAVLSNKPDSFTQQMVPHIFADGLFDLVVGHRPEFPLKPDPASALDIARRLGVQPAETAFVGDSAMDMQTANSAGMFAVGVAWGFRSRQELQDNGCEVLIEHPRDLPSALSL